MEIKLRDRVGNFIGKTTILKKKRLWRITKKPKNYMESLQD